MTTTIPATDTDRAPRMLARLGGLALVAAPVLFLGGNLTSPPQADGGTAAYIASLAADLGVTALSAGLYHYGWIAVAFGVLAAIGLVRGTRGRALTMVSAVIGAFGAMQISGLLLADHYLAAAGSQLPLDAAATLVDTAGGSLWVAAWMITAQVGALLGTPLVLAGLARAGVIGWWAAPVYFTAWIVPGFLPMPFGALLAFAASTPLILVGIRLVRRSTSAVVAAGRTH